jgi:hypothetical protein
MIIKIFRELWAPIDIREHPDMLFVYSSDEEGTNYEGQACIRDEPNALGIPARIGGGTKRKSLYNDKELEINKIVIKKAVDNIVAKLASPKNKYTGVVLPEPGLGHLKDDGDLGEVAPDTYDFMISEVNRLIKLVSRI